MKSYFRRLVLIIPVMCALLFCKGCAKEEEKIVILCGAGLRPPIEEITGIFRQKTGIKAKINFSPSNLLLGHIKTGAAGDVFIPGDIFYIEEAEKYGLIEETQLAALFVPVIMVQKGNPLDIRELKDLQDENTKLGLADERTAAIGRLTVKLFEKNNIPIESVLKNTVFTGVSVNDLANALVIGHIDATIVFKPVAMQHTEKAEIIEISPEKNIISPIAAALLSDAKNKTDARRFLDFMISAESRRIFAKYHYNLPDDVNAISDNKASY